MVTFIVVDSNPLEGAAYAHIIQKSYPNIQYIEQAFTSTQGLALIREVQPDIAIVDIDTIGNIRGLTLIRAMRDISPRTSIVLTSINIEDARYLQNVMRLGVEDYYLKPINNRDLDTLFSKLESKSKQKFLQADDSNKIRFKALVDTFQSGTTCSANTTLDRFWNIVTQKQFSDLESLSVFCIEFATSVMYYSGGRKYQPETLSIAYSRFIREISLCNSQDDIRQKLADFLNACADTLNQNLHNPDNPQVVRAKKLIESHVENGQAVTLEIIAGEVFLSSAYLSRLFKKCEDMNLIDYIQKCRLDKAMRLLRETNDSIITIADKCGYSECNSFRRLFKKKLGLSPSEYRDMSRQK